MQDPKYVINLVELQNINTSASGENGVQDLQNMVNFQNKTVYTDFLNSYSGGVISVGNPLVLSGNITVGGTIITTSTGSGSSGLTVSGTAGISTVYDTLYNPPIISIGSKLTASPYSGGAVTGDGFTLTRSGLFYVQVIATVGSGGNLPINGYLTGALLADGLSAVVGSQQTIVANSLAVPASGSLTWTYGGICSLGTAASYTYQINSSGAGWDLGSGGGISVTVYRLS